MLLIALGVLGALGIYGGIAGPAGNAVDTASGAAIGLVRWFVPPALIVFGILLLRNVPEEDGPGSDDPLLGVRLALAAALITIALTGLLHLSQGEPAWGEEAEKFVAAGGVLGAAVARPLTAGLDTAGAVLALVTVGLLGLVLGTRASVHALGRRAGAGMSPLARGLRSSVGSLFRVDGQGAPEAEPDVQSGFFDQEAEGFGDDEAEPDEEVIDLTNPSMDLAAPEPPEVIDDGEIAPRAPRGPWKLPPARLLERMGKQDVDRRLVEETGRRLEAALAEHDVQTRLVGMVVGPTVTRFELELGPGVKVARVTSLHKDIAYAMASPDVRILAPIPGKQAIGVEVPNIKREVVALGDLMAAPEVRAAKAPLAVPMGRDIGGRTHVSDLAKMPHILIAGATGAGKSSCINSIITSVLMRTTPDEVRMILVDPKMVELGQYDRLPHLLTQVVVDPKKAANALAWATREMDRRYEVLHKVGVRDLGGYNAAVDAGRLDPDVNDQPYERLPYILVVVDELNDLMMVAARDVEDSICRIAQKARAVGIHLVIATQRPSVNVITGVIKANVPARLAFAVSSLADSRVILDQPGAERLVGQGDMLLVDANSSIPHRLQGAWVTEEEVRGVVGHWRRQSPEVQYVEGVEGDTSGGSGSGAGGGGDDDDDLLLAAMDLVVRSQLGSTSMLQRKLRVGFARAGRIMDLLEQRGVVGPSEGSKARAVLMTETELNEIQGNAE
ncbi:MAG TPA: DNA translocase FtsK 4TM domain-containing protein [Actinomycetota bacterium]|nr:DNA translocase FtsK 4TM domain-containing protein [Actinomycetota bacterium]